MVCVCLEGEKQEEDNTLFSPTVCCVPLFVSLLPEVAVVTSLVAIGHTVRLSSSCDRRAVPGTGNSFSPEKEEPVY